MHHDRAVPGESRDREQDEFRLPSGTEVTRLLCDWNGRQHHAVLQAVYDVLREMAASRMAASRGDVLLQPTVLVHEALLRMMGPGTQYRDRLHFFALAALKMRSVLVDHARASLAQKRGGGALRVTLSQADLALPAGTSPTADYQVLALHEGLERFARLDPRASRALELAYFGGMNHAEIATVLEVSVPTVERDLRIGRAWLKRYLDETPA